ncbi:MAG: hypothetical protein P0S93_06100, partial [Candidatus Neptunochlamydia sp.]|nr:hypothetical protein [Candidatus Neptunochlamydia sp.]
MQILSTFSFENISKHISQINSPIKNLLAQSTIYTAVIGVLWKNRRVAILSKESIPYAGLLASYVGISALSMKVCDKNKVKVIVPLLMVSTAALAAYGYFGKDKTGKSINQTHLWVSFAASSCLIGLGSFFIHKLRTSYEIKEANRSFKFEKYVEDHCPNINPQEALKTSKKGCEIIKEIIQGNRLEDSNKRESLRSVCWFLMYIAVINEQPFIEGTFDLEDKNYQFFNFFKEIFYSRRSTHYNTRKIPDDQGTKDLGCDLERLPAGKRTVLMGRIQTLGGAKHIFIKMENSGADFNIFKGGHLLKNTAHLVRHALGFMKSQAKRRFPKRFGEVGGDPLHRKEHMLEKDKKRCHHLLRKVNPTIYQDRKVDFDDYGFQFFIPELQEYANGEEIKKNLVELENRYGKNI